MIWSNESSDSTKQIFQLQKCAVRIIKHGNKETVTCRGKFKELGILTLTSICIMQISLYAKKFLSTETNSTIHTYNTRNTNLIHVNSDTTSIKYLAIKTYNKLPAHLKNLSLKPVKSQIKKFLINHEFYNYQEFWSQTYQ